jgi:hypothetical protein
MSWLSTSLENQTIPHLDTVAKVAYFKVSTSNIILTLLGIASRSPLGRVKSLFWIHVSVEYYPVSFLGFSLLVFENLSKNTGKDSILPFHGKFVHFSIQLIFDDSFGINNIFFPFDFINNVHSL